MAKYYNRVVKLSDSKEGVEFVTLTGSHLTSVAFNAASALNTPLSSSTTTILFANSATPAVSGSLSVNTAYNGASFEVMVGTKSFEFTFTVTDPLSAEQEAAETADTDTFWDPERRRRRLLGYI